MEQVNERMREITEFLRNLNFKKKGGGVDKEDVLDKIEQLTIMYHMILEEQSDTIEALQAQNQALVEQAQTVQIDPAPIAVSDNRIMEMSEQMNRLHAALSEAQRTRQEAEEKTAELRAAMERQQAAMKQLQAERAAAPVAPTLPLAPVAPPAPNPDKDELARQEFYLQALRREIATLEERRADMERNLLTEVRALEAIRRMREENQKAATAEKTQLREGLRGLREECVRVLSAVSEFDNTDEEKA
ncbi:MAG: hypothetical protein FWF10_04470 [Clostridiales bacterium]|nr:hypothetical protein [Clostridiales bacterium]